MTFSKFILFVILVSPLSLGAQQYIGQKRSDIQKTLTGYKLKESKLVNSDSTLSFTFKDEKTGKITEIFSFDHAGNCIREKIITENRSGYEQYLGTLLAQKKYDWKKINENQYVSRFEDALMLETPFEDSIYYFTVFRVVLDKELYKTLTGNK